MTTALTEEQELLRSTAREFLLNECPMTWAREWMEGNGRHSETLWKQLAEMGWLGLLFSERVGGAELGFVEQAIVLEELGRSLTPTPYLPTLIASLIVDAAASGAKRDEILTAVASGERVLSFALIEANGEDADAILTHCSDSGALFGEKLFVPHADDADMLLVAART